LKKDNKTGNEFHQNTCTPSKVPAVGGCTIFSKKIKNENITGFIVGKK
jgi:hypothetical protein